MSRYSRIFLRHKESGNASSWTAESSSKMSTVEPASTSSPGFSYPPSSTSRYSPFPMSSNSAPISASPVSSPRTPHPYTLGAMSYAATIDSTTREETSTISHAQRTRDTHKTDFSNREKPPDDGPVGHQYHPRTALPLDLPPEDIQSPRPPLPLHLRPLVLLLLFLPIPPLLSFTYLVTGHAFLRAIEMSSNSIYHTPLLASLEAGAAGGVILSLPLAALLYLFFFPSRSTSTPAGGEDFFEDDSSSILVRATWLRYTGYIVCTILFVCVGGAAGPLGVTCLSSGSLASFVGDKKMLSTSAAAAAGLVGGVLVALAVLAICVVLIGAWTLWIRQRDSDGS
ncbi:hypothetical protein CVT26_008998 [Gymnopilus dilepis]|uniref:Uncharacterized protein n=1 Tax=Gymnopilus dilepis TaxID=231916 RepID=A0A409YR76_9AGAR|nr:hypothetical protein CVT26_008998 [Gymnopilus dilepis]